MFNLLVSLLSTDAPAHDITCRQFYFAVILNNQVLPVYRYEFDMVEPFAFFVFRKDGTRDVLNIEFVEKRAKITITTIHQSVTFEQIFSDPKEAMLAIITLTFETPDRVYYM